MIEEEQNNPSEISLQFPQRISRISSNRQRSTNNESLMRTLENLSNQRQYQSQSRLNSSHFQSRNNITYSDAGTIKRKRKNRKKKEKKQRQKKRLTSRTNKKKLTDVLGQNSDFTEIGNIALNDLLNKNLTKPLDDIESCNENGSEDEVNYVNNINTVKQKVKVSNVNCSCRVF
jgi:hypothetical protein